MINRKDRFDLIYVFNLLSMERQINKSNYLLYILNTKENDYISV